MLYYLPRVNILRSVLNITFMSCYMEQSFWA